MIRPNSDGHTRAVAAAAVTLAGDATIARSARLKRHFD